ncbi:MAG TPA: hypothetical protein VK867_07585 [Candidatus Limnocylindrales bacterium]|nr:hypothetical protein [Candidatus Limnocylindrales bacterium]
MLPTDIDLDQAHERLERFATDAARRRHGPTTTGLRRAIGHRFIALGRRIAAEPTLELSRATR